MSVTRWGETLAFPTPPDVVPEVPRPPERIGTPQVIAQGGELFESHMCGGCHGPGLDGSGAWTVNGAVPDLKYAPPDVHQLWDAIVLGGSHREQGMMAFGVEQHYPDITALTPEEATAIHAYVIDEAWKAYNEQLKERP